ARITSQAFTKILSVMSGILSLTLAMIRPVDETSLKNPISFFSAEYGPVKSDGMKVKPKGLVGISSGNKSGVSGCSCVFMVKLFRLRRERFFDTLKK
ncbi:TPA: hypothetical protein DDW35_13780, partial [Candidatus Sumerlaeota bacterium]|nr:hypothetical protein [Candidatus Sumerlaeota bacterium]